MKRFFFRSFVLLFLVREKLTRRFTITGVFVLVCLGASAFIGLDTNQTLVYQVFAFLFFLVTISLAFTLRFRPAITLTPTLPRYATAGEPFQYRIQIRNRMHSPQIGLYLLEDIHSPLPTYEEFETAKEPDAGRRNRFDRAIGYFTWLYALRSKMTATIQGEALPDLSVHGPHGIQKTLTPLQRGILRINGFYLIRQDPFGLVKSYVKINHEQSVTVLPRRYPVPDIRLPGKRRYQSGGVAMASSVGDSEEFVSLRDYQPGDPMRRIHWKSWAKTNKPVVKEYQDEFFVRHALILDTFTGKPFSDNFEKAVSLAASLVLHVRTQDALLDMMFVGLQAFCFTSGRGLGHADSMLEILASVKTCQDKTFSALEPLVVERSHLLSGVIILLLDWDHDRRSFIGKLKAMGLPLMVWVITDEQEKGALDPGPMADSSENFKVIRAGYIEEDMDYV